MMQPLWKTAWQFLRKLNTESPYDPAIPLLGYKPKRTESRGSYRYLYTVFLSTHPISVCIILFTVVKRWKQPICPSTDKQNIVHMYSGIIFSL